MGRSKFPGKPSKHCHRKRINVLPLTGELSNACGSSLVTVTRTSNENKQDEELAEKEGESTPRSDKSKPLRERLPRKLNASLRKNARQRSFISKIRSKATLKGSRSTRNAISKNLIRKDSNFAGKFVLPTRSVHSSRVIKPNKRFIDLNESLNVRKKVLVAKRPLTSEETSSISKLNDGEDKMTFTNGHRVILRQARLKLPNQIGTHGPFSTKLHNGPGSIICGVCGAVRYYRFVKQARKFNIYSCESCRKFISKQIKRQSVGSKSSNTLPCHMGQGACYIPPVVQSHHWKIAKCAYRSRCPACWLKMCLKAYQLPITLKQNLTQLLPKNMRGLDFLFSSTLPPILWQKNFESLSENVEANTKQRPVRFKSQKFQVTSLVVTCDVKRQKIGLKGPRVKHVCRSASIVLGQPIATFSSHSSEKKSDIPDTATEKNLSDVKFSDCKQDSTDEESVSNSSVSYKSYFEKSSSVLPKRERIKSSLPLASNNNNYTEASTSDVVSPIPPEEQTILLEYSDELNYENRFEIGYSLIGSEKFSLSAICYLCGSVGQESMLVCSVCCESYHTFCVDNYRPESSCDWVCMKCSPCEGCKGHEKHKISCPKCLKVYHSECLGGEGSCNLKLVCKECAKCQDCGNTIAYVLSNFPGNMPLCLKCTDKWKVGMYCPICQHLFNANNGASKMLECAKCKKWVHPECEKLTSEQYDILKLLPISLSFTCSHCLEDAHTHWNRSVQRELFHSFNNILRLLVKNKTAKSIFKQGLKRAQLGTSNFDVDNNNYKKDITVDDSDKLKKEPKFTVNTLAEIKSRLCKYNSVKKFHNDMKEALKSFQCEQIFLIYKTIFQNTFPWFSYCHKAAEDSPGIPYVHLHLQHQKTDKNTIAPSKDQDPRLCELCKKVGDGFANQESRLLYCGKNVWVHANCAYWSNDVHEGIDDHLQNVLETIEKYQSTRCAGCGNTGASVHCSMCKSENYHFMCARKSNWCFTTVKKACFCPLHSLEHGEYVLKGDNDYELNRSMFVEKPFLRSFKAALDKVHCIVGSLSVRNLGKIEPLLSDNQDFIVPTGFVCSRVFWSTVEPWRLVTYLITTSIQNPNCSTLTVEKNFTVDHSLDKRFVDKAVKELNAWQKEHTKKSEDVELDEEEEEKNGAELLSPELTDTILKDLPHDILDGISVQDIFPNFSYEDMLTLDNSNTESIAESLKKPEDDDSVEIGREWTRTKSDTSIKSSRVLTLSYKLDSALQPVSKKRRIARDPTSMPLLLQIDGNFDDSSSSECGSPVDTCFDRWTFSEEPVTCEKCQCTYRTQASYKRHLDSCEMLCTSESDSENVPEAEMVGQCDGESVTTMVEANEVPLQITEATQPVLISSFETFQSQVHTSLMNVVPEEAPRHAPQPITMPPTLAIADSPATISIPVPLCVGSSLTPQIVPSSLDFQQAQPQPMALQPVQQVLVQRPRPAQPEPVMLQQIQPAPTPGFMPFVEAFAQPQTNQGLQYVQIAPQMSTVQPQTQLLQIRPDGSVIGILPSIQPATVIVQQPQQLVLDSSGAFGWTQQPQPQIYYGFETIVQNTVMQSQQFLPTPVPGVLTANSSYSTTTQVFQTSKLEPVLDVSSNSFVLVNPGQLEIPQQYSQNQAGTVVTSQTPTLIYSQPSTTQRPIAAAPHNCISLPTAPFVSDQNIPMNIVPPIPKPPTSHGRPMSRVLPMPTNTVKAPKKIADTSKIFKEDKFIIEKPAHIKLEEGKFLISKDLVKIMDSPKAKNRKFEILDCKIIKSHNNMAASGSPETFKFEEKPFKEFEPIEKASKLSEPLRELKKSKLDMFEEPINTLKLINDEKYLKIDGLKTLDSLEHRLKTFESIHFHNVQKMKNDLQVQKNKVEISLQKEQMQHRLQKSRDLQKQGQHHMKLNLHNSKMDVNVQRTHVEVKVQLPRRNVIQPKVSTVKNILNVSFSQRDVNLHCKTNLKQEPEKTLQIHINEDVNKPKEQIVDKVSGNNEHTALDFQSEETKIRSTPAVAAPLRPFKLQGKSRKTDDKPTVTTSAPKQQSTKKYSEYCAPSILYTVENPEGYKYSSASVEDCWAKVFEAVQNARAVHKMTPLPSDGKQLKSIQLMGLKSSHMKYLVEQLPGASKCYKYKPLFNFMPHPADVAASTHGFGSARCQPRQTGNTEPYDMFSWLSSKHRQPCMSLDSQIVQSRRVNSFPMAMKFRNLKQTSRWSVGVYRSKIHGKGLFCLRDIEPGEMVIEYAGEVIRSILTDKREKLYNSKGIGCYMFRVDDNFVVDATMKGNAARFINHSCDPNCYSKVVEILGHKHIVIFALRRILSGEELTYDYKFPFEEDKIPCTCGARRCRKFLN